MLWVCPVGITTADAKQSNKYFGAEVVNVCGCDHFVVVILVGRAFLRTLF